jgi:hypothetical protein
MPEPDSTQSLCMLVGLDHKLAMHAAAVHGIQHPAALDSLANLGRRLVASGLLPQADHTFETVWRGRQEKLGDAHPMAHVALRELTELRRRRGLLSAQAEENSEKLLKSRTRKLGETHPLTRDALRELSETQRRRDVAEDAERILHENKCHSIRTRHPTYSREHAAAMHTTRACLGSHHLLNPMASELADTLTLNTSASDGALSQLAHRRIKRERRVARSSMKTSEEADVKKWIHAEALKFGRASWLGLPLGAACSQAQFAEEALARRAEIHGKELEAQEARELAEKGAKLAQKWKNCVNFAASGQK